MLVVDDVGITAFDRTKANAFFQAVNRRHENRSATIVTTNRGAGLGRPLRGRLDVGCGPSWSACFNGRRSSSARTLRNPLTDVTYRPRAAAREAAIALAPEPVLRTRISVSGDIGHDQPPSTGRSFGPTETERPETEPTRCVRAILSKWPRTRANAFRMAS
ncbi:MAG: hypothetical protein ACRD6W_00450 [Nitrososphaerales archaeon]